MLNSQQPRLRVRINDIDHTVVQPGSLDNSSLPLVPVIRIYGTSSTGKNTCVHVHQVYPYFFVEYTATLDPIHVNRYIAKLTASLNHAIAISLKRNPNSPNARYIRAILLVKGIHFYGFHSSYTPFLKIFVADPAYASRTITILQSGTVMSTRFRTFESHLSFTLQFMADFSLYGCGWIDLVDVLQRGTENEDQNQDQEPGSPCSTEFDSIPFNHSPYMRQSRMPLEVDVTAPQILNRHLVTARNIHHKLKISAYPLPSEPLVLSVRELWEDERNRRRANGLSPSPEIPVDPSDASRGPGGDWVAEVRWWEEIQKRIEREQDMEFDVAESEPWEKWTMSTFESIEALWETPWRVWRPNRGSQTETRVFGEDSTNDWNEDSAWFNTEDNMNEYGDVDVDVSILTSQEVSHLVEEEEEWNKFLADAHPAEEEPNEEAYDEAEPSQNVDSDKHLLGSQLTPPGSLSSPDPFQEDDTGLQTPIKEFRLHHLTQSGPDREGTPTRPLKRRRTLDSSPVSTNENDLFNCDIGQHSIHNVTHAQVDSNNINDNPRPSKKQRIDHIDPGPHTHSVHSSRSPSLLLTSKPQVIAAPSIRLYPAMGINKTRNMNGYVYALPTPHASDLLASLEENDIPSKIYRHPYYSNYADISERPREYAGLQYHLKGDDLSSLDEWDNGQSLKEKGNSPFISMHLSAPGWEYASSPPNIRQVKKWLVFEGQKPKKRLKRPEKETQFASITQANIYGFKDTPGVKATSTRDRRSMTILSFEVFVPTRGEKVPDADIDAIEAAFYTYQDSDTAKRQTGIIAAENAHLDQRRLRHMELDVVANEIDLINRVVDIVMNLDPDIIVGWETQCASWGYLDARGQHHGFDIADLISRAPIRYIGKRGADRWGIQHSSSLKVAGRHVLNLWRIMRAEQTLNSYTFENVVFHILRKRTPWYSFSSLTEWYYSSSTTHTNSMLRYFGDRCTILLELLEETDIITKTAEFARVFGVDFFSVINRGSQFKVESFMFRIAKPESFVFPSPSRHDVGKQNAAECMPLIMEPLSAFYSSPLVVLDFQSLYPSLMIAYNYCYSTCLGRVTDFQGRNKLGVVDLHNPPGLLNKLRNHINVAPNGIVYVKPEVRKGLLGRMLVELLETRIMVKQSLKDVKNDKALKRVLDARQLSLKYICNVTYGYTSATFSGRMPAVEIADSIVQSGRETLEKAIVVINTTKKWGAQVVYGDTDSVFVYLQGKTKDQAFRIGNEIADTITALNPSPVKLKFEKVYLPCVLMAKKRYVGFKYENIDDREPVFDAKGIETVRKDGILAQRKMVEHCLKILFRTQDLSEVREYCCRSWAKLLENKVSVQDFIFAKEVRMGTYSDKIPPPPGVAVAARWMVGDPKKEPQYGERVPYVITRSHHSSKLVDRAMDPWELLNDRNSRLDAVYYITRVLIPPLERIFNLVGANVQQWYTEMPKLKPLDSLSPAKAKDQDQSRPFEGPNIDEHFHSSQCFACGGIASHGICDNCYSAPQITMSNLASHIQANDRRLVNAHRICTSCTGTALSEPIKCQSIDCPWFFSRKGAEDRVDFLTVIHDLLEGLAIDTVS